MTVVESPLESRAPLMRVREVAVFVNVDKFLVYRALESGDLRGFKVGSRPKAPWRVRVEDVERWANV